MTTDAAGKVTVVGLDKLLTKLDSKIPEHAKQRLYKKSGEEGKANLSPRLPHNNGPRSLHSADKLSLSITTEKASITVPAYPLRFIEFGTIQHTGEGKRSHSKRSLKATKALVSAGGWRISPRKFIALTRAWLKRQLPGWISEEETNVKHEWDSA